MNNGKRYPFFLSTDYTFGVEVANVTEGELEELEDRVIEVVDDWIAEHNLRSRPTRCLSRSKIEANPNYRR